MFEVAGCRGAFNPQELFDSDRRICVLGCLFQTQQDRGRRIDMIAKQERSLVTDFPGNERTRKRQGIPGVGCNRKLPDPCMNIRQRMPSGDSVKTSRPLRTK
jgi:hypothetical protein